MFVTGVHARLLRPGFGAIEASPGAAAPHPLRQALARVDREIDQMVDRAKLDAIANNTRSKAS